MIYGEELGAGGISTKTIPPQGLNLTLKGGNGKIDCTFTGITSEWLYLGQYYRLIAKPGSAPTSPMDGVQIKDVQVGAIGDAVISASIEGLTNGVQYYVRLYVRGENGWQTSVDAVGTATPTAGLLVADMPVGTLIVDPESKYYNAPIVWKIADIDHHLLDAGYPADAATLISDKAIKLCCFDAKEPNNSDSSRKTSGNNRYIYSNIRQWLNGAASAGNWYGAQHSADAPPTNANVQNNYNEYSADVGFQNGFSAEFRNALLNTAITVGRAAIDGGGTETCIDKMYLASCTEVNLTGSVTCGSRLSIFTDDASRQTSQTPECAANSEKNTYGGYWLRDAYASSTYNVYSCRPSGIYNSQAFYYGYGIRPLCNISKSTLLSPDQNADGTYSIIGFA